MVDQISDGVLIWGRDDDGIRVGFDVDQPEGTTVLTGYAQTLQGHWPDLPAEKVTHMLQLCR